MSNLCEFMEYRDEEDSMCTSPSCSECNIYKALERQVPKKPVTLKRDKDYKVGAITFRAGTTLYKCQCGNIIRQNDSYCFNCGQAIDWSVEE